MGLLVKSGIECYGAGPNRVLCFLSLPDTLLLRCRSWTAGLWLPVLFEWLAAMVLALAVPSVCLGLPSLEGCW